MAVAARGGGVLIVSAEAAAHFYPATPEQVVNACYAAGFRMVNRGVLGDELVAAEYLKLWRDDSWGTLIRSTDPVVVDTIRRDYPELVPYLAPVTIPAVAEARYLRALLGERLEIVFAGVCPPAGRPELDAAITFRDLDQLLRLRGVSPLAQPDYFERVPSERRRHLSTAGGLPVAMLEEAPYSSRRFRKVRGLKELPSLARAVSEPDRPRLRRHPVARGVAGPPALGAARRAVLAPDGGGERRGAAQQCTGGGSVGGGELRRRLPDRAPAGAVRSDPGRGDPRADRPRPQRPTVGLPGLRIRDLRRVRAGGGGGSGLTAAVLPRTRPGGSRRRSGTRRWTR